MNGLMLNSAVKRWVSSYCACIANSKWSSPCCADELGKRVVAKAIHADERFSRWPRIERQCVDDDLQRLRTVGGQRGRHGVGDQLRSSDQLGVLEAVEAQLKERRSVQRVHGAEQVGDERDLLLAE